MSPLTIRSLSGGTVCPSPFRAGGCGGARAGCGGAGHSAPGRARAVPRFPGPGVAFGLLAADTRGVAAGRTGLVGFKNAGYLVTALAAISSAHRLVAVSLLCDLGARGGGSQYATIGWDLPPLQKGATRSANRAKG